MMSHSPMISLLLLWLHISPLKTLSPITLISIQTEAYIYLRGIGDSSVNAIWQGPPHVGEFKQSPPRVGEFNFDCPISKSPV